MPRKRFASKAGHTTKGSRSSNRKSAVNLSLREKEMPVR